MAGRTACDERRRCHGSACRRPGGDPASPENGILDKRDLITGLSDDERTLLGEALRVLRRERGAAWNAACDAAEAQGKRQPSLRAYGIDDIRRLARRLGVRATHWTEE